MNRAVLIAGAVGFVAGYLGNFALERVASYAMRPPACRGCGRVKQAQLTERMGLYALMAGSGR